MPNVKDTLKECNRVSDFYNGKSIFITGAAGYLGSILLEILLRCLPGISNVYILLRHKKGIDPESRKALMFKKWIFNKVLEENPNITDKVHVIAGDVALPNLGMNDEDSDKITKTVSIVFHVAATISFFKTLRKTAEPNCLGTLYIIEFCKKISNLEAFVYTSTAFSNCNRTSEILEKIYSFPFKMKEFVEALKNGNEAEFENFASMCQPKWPNNYTISKCLAENIINEMASNLPTAIVRPSIIAPTWKGVRPGYVEEGSGLIDFSVAVGKGFARVICCDPKSRFDLIPADIVANTHIVAAWSIGTQRSTSPFVVNCTGGHTWHVSFEDYCNAQIKMVRKHMLPNTFQEPDIIYVRNKYIYFIYAIYEHYLPAYFIDLILWMKGKKLRVSRLYVFFEKVMLQLSFFISNTFDFIVDNFNSLSKQLDPRDNEIFYMDLKDVDMQQIANNIPKASQVYNWDADKKSPEKRKRVVVMRSMMISFVKRFSMMILFYLLYVIYCKVF